VKWPEQPQLKQVWPKVVPSGSGASRLDTGGAGGRALDAPADAGAEVGGKPTVATGAGGGATDEAGRWDRGATTSGT
jgi:hypothetical protein